MASALFGMRAAPSRRNGGPRPSSALPLNRARRPRFADGGGRWGQKPARPLRGSAAPPCALAAPSRAAAAAGGPSGRLPPSHFFGAVAVGSSGATPPPSPRSPVLLRPAKVGGGLLQRPLAAAPLRRRAPPLRPRPLVLAPGRGYFVFAAAGLGIAPPAGGAKGLPGCTRCAIRCGVHGFAMNPCDSTHPATAPYCREARVTLARRQTACGMRHCFARRIEECHGRRKLSCTPTRWVERQRIIEESQIV